MRVAVYGGSFNPPHMGHALVSAWLRWADRADEVWLVPTSVHPFAKDLAPFEDRVRWCEALAATLGPWVRVEPIEASLSGVSYTVQTLDALAARHPGVAFRLVLGADNLRDTPKWRAWDRIQAVYEPVVVGREGWPEVPDAPTFPGISSTEVRRRLARGEPVDHLVPAAVLAVLQG